MCSTHKILVELNHPIEPIVCSSIFGKRLSISPFLPNGLAFVNNTIYGTIRSKIELTPFTITSEADKMLPVIIHIGGNNFFLFFIALEATLTKADTSSSFQFTALHNSATVFGVTRNLFIFSTMSEWFEKQLKVLEK